jgi:hypothetical protein
MFGLAMASLVPACQMYQRHLEFAAVQVDRAMRAQDPTFNSAEFFKGCNIDPTKVKT